jgi:ribosomal protein S8E
MPYGLTEQKGLWVKRKPVESLSPNEIENIRDPGIQRIIIARLRDKGVVFGRGAKVDAKAWKETLANLKMPSGVPIKKVRVVKPELTVRPIREETANVAHVKPGATHHLSIFEFEENGTAKREAVFVTLLEAVDRLKRLKRLKRREPMIQRVHPERADARFVMSLSRGEAVLVDWEGQEKLLVFRTAASTTGQLHFAEHSDARKSDEWRDYRATANTLIVQRKARKVVVASSRRVNG